LKYGASKTIRSWSPEVQKRIPLQVLVLHSVAHLEPGLE